MSVLRQAQSRDPHHCGLKTHANVCLASPLFPGPSCPDRSGSPSHSQACPVPVLSCRRLHHDSGRIERRDVVHSDCSCSWSTAQSPAPPSGTQTVSQHVLLGMVPFGTTTGCVLRSRRCGSAQLSSSPSYSPCSKTEFLGALGRSCLLPFGTIHGLPHRQLDELFSATFPCIQTNCFSQRRASIQFHPVLPE